MLIELAILLLFVPPLVVLVRFIVFLVKGSDRFNRVVGVLTDLAMMVGLPAYQLFISVTPQNCCDSDGFNIFSVDHLLTIVIWCVLGASAYFYVSYRKQIASPVVEVVVAWTMLFCIGLNVFIIIQMNEFAWVFCPPIIIQLLMALVKQHRQLAPRLEQITRPDMLDSIAMPGEIETQQEVAVIPAWQSAFYSILNWPAASKYPLIMVMGIPVFILVDSVLLLFDQRPDSLILAFTQTYHMYYSELDYLCEGVSCGGHYLCSVAANGHQSVVKPIRMGIRAGRPIICNRQLLVANAFEEILQERFPAAHRLIRRHYDRVGDFIHKDYTPYKNKYLCDLIYLLMKPADWVFRFILYTVDRAPEERIARQYRPG